MTREQFVKYKFKGYQLIAFKHKQMDEPVDCMLVGVDFDTEILTLRQFPDGPFVKDDFQAHISMCELARPRLKLTKKLALNKS